MKKKNKKILKITEDYFGKKYFDKLNKLTEDVSSVEDKYKNSLTVNFEGAFYASEK